MKKYSLNNNSNEIMSLFSKEIERRKTLKKLASGEISLPVDDTVKPEDFLISEVPTDDLHSTSLDSKIESLAKDSEVECEKCHKAHDSETCPTEHMADDSESDKDKEKENDAEDCSYLIDAKAKYVLSELGKIASELKTENRFAADLVEATALDIKNDLLKEARKKLNVMNELKKMASESYRNGDIMAGDLITVTIDNIKKS